jgi:hypothetical protein
MSITTWTPLPLHKALAHVAAHEGSRQLAEKQLLWALGDERRIRSRAGCVIASRAKVRERVRVDQPLPPYFWHWPEYEMQASVNWDDDIATISSTHPAGPCEAYRIVVAQEDLFAIWQLAPELEPAAPEHELEAYGAGAKQREVQAMDRQLNERAAELKLKGVSDPKTQAWNELAVSFQ